MLLNNLSQKRIHKNKFSLRTAQEYTNLLDSCKGQYRQTRNKSSSSRSNHSITQRPSHPLAKHSIPILQPRHLAMRERIGERSNSQRNRSGSSDTNSLNSLNFKKEVKQRRPIQIKRPIRKQQIASYEQQHLIINLEVENKDLIQRINQNQNQIAKKKAQIQLQARTQEMQRKLYQDQIRKLSQELEMQTSTRASNSLESECSIEKQLSQEAIH